MSAQPESPPVLPPSSEDEIYRWRKEGFEKLNFSSLQADSLARKKDADPHRVRKALQHGCTIELAIRIFL
jgi:hypothetical protein